MKYVEVASLLCMGQVGALCISTEGTPSTRPVEMILLRCAHGHFVTLVFKQVGFLEMRPCETMQMVLGVRLFTRSCFEVQGI